MRSDVLPGLGIDLCARITQAIETVRAFAPTDGQAYLGAFSGGKDSVALKTVVGLSGVACEWHYHNTTIDPPELHLFIRKHHPDVIWDRSKYGPMLRRMIVNGFPTRRNRWCCEEYKHGANPPGSTVLLGVRAAESPRRAKTWKICTPIRQSASRAVAPLLYWSDGDVWDFIRSRKLEYCSLYDEGFKRLGCIGCPMAGKSRAVEFARWPQFERAWRRSFRALWDRRVAQGKADGSIARWRSADEMFEWWKEAAPIPPLPGEEPEECQTTLDMWSSPDDREEEDDHDE